MATRKTTNISLSPQWQRFIAGSVRTGRYQSASEVVREGLRLLEQRDTLAHSAIDDLNRQIQVGIDEADRGLGIDAEEAFDRLLADLRPRRARTR